MNWDQIDTDRIKGNQARMTVGPIWDDVPVEFIRIQRKKYAGR